MFLFASIIHKKRFYTDFNPNRSDLIVIECGGGSVLALADFSASLVVPCCSHHELMDILRGIPLDANKEMSSRHLNTLVIENLSAFYWNLACELPSERYLWYRELNSELHQLKQKYGCNVVVTCWNVDYDRGFSARPLVDRKPEKLRDLSYFPSELFRGATHVLHFDGGCMEFRGNGWHAVE